MVVARFVAGVLAGAAALVALAAMVSPPWSLRVLCMAFIVLCGIAVASNRAR